MEAVMMDNYEMARGHAAVGLAGRAVGSGRFSSSELQVTMPLGRGEPCLTSPSAFPRKATKHNGVTICSCFSDQSARSGKEF